MAANPDHVELAAVAKELIEENGRDLYLVKWTRAPADPAAPHRARIAGDGGASVVGAIVKMEVENPSNGATEECYVAADSLAPGLDLTEFTLVIETTNANSSWRILATEKIAPGEVVIAYRMELAR